MFTKAKIYNLTLGSLLLQRRIVNAETDPSNEAKILETFYDVAFRSTLEDLDLDSTSTQAELELIEENPNELWLYSYKYPTDCAFFRRIQSANVVDNRSSHVPKRVSTKDGKKVIFCNTADAIAEYISYDVPLNSLSASVGICISYKLAMLAAPLITGKGAAKLIEKLETSYKLAKAEAEEQDRKENFVFVDEDIESEFVEARKS